MTPKELATLRNNYIIAYRQYCDEWCALYEDWKNVSYSDKKVITTDAGLNYLTAKLLYNEAIKKQDIE